jgi:hypothetical protein
VTVACYTCPLWHPSAHFAKGFGPGWSEYTVMRGARPWFQGHHQPRTPLLGERDERDPATWELYIDLAAGHGVDVFIWDTYWYAGRPALHEALEDGYLGARNRDRVGFAAMWTNHPWVGRDGRPSDDDDTLEGCRRSLGYLATRYFHEPGYWRIGGVPVLVVWDLAALLERFGIEQTAGLFAWLRRLSRSLGHDGVHLHANCTPALARAGWKLAGGIDQLDQLEATGFDSYGIYTSIVPAGFARPRDEELPDYATLTRDVAEQLWPALEAASQLPFFPSVSPGYDESPRTIPDVVPWWEGAPRSMPPERGAEPDRTAWPGTGLIVVGETPDRFASHVSDALAHLAARPGQPQVLTIGCWNEFTEGQYLLPDTRLGSGMLQALARARARASAVS